MLLLFVGLDPQEIPWIFRIGVFFYFISLSFGHELSQVSQPLQPILYIVLFIPCSMYM